MTKRFIVVAAKRLARFAVKDAVSGDVKLYTDSIVRAAEIVDRWNQQEYQGIDEYDGSSIMDSHER